MSGASILAGIGAIAAVWLGMLVGSLPKGDPWDLWVPLLRVLTFGGAGLLAAVAFVTYYSAHPPDGRILVDDEGITVDNPAVFRGPVRIPRAAVRSVSVERDVPSLPAQLPLEMFPIERGAFASGRDTHLASRLRRRYLLPGINPEPVVPNLAVVLDSMIEVSPIRFRGSLAPGYSPFKPPMWQRRIPGFFVRVTDVDAAARVFENWGVLRAPRTEEVAGAADAYSRQRRVQLAIAIGVFVAAVLITGVLDRQPP